VEYRSSTASPFLEMSSAFRLVAMGGEGKGEKEKEEMMEVGREDEGRAEETAVLLAFRLVTSKVHILYILETLFSN